MPDDRDLGPVITPAHPEQVMLAHPFSRLPAGTMDAPISTPEPAPRVPLLSRILIAGVAVLTVIALLGAWVDRQLLNSEDWKRTSAALLSEDAIRVPVADAIAGQIADGSRASGAVEELSSMLPPRLQPVADAVSGLAATATRDAVQSATQRVLANGRVQEAWVNATLAAQQALVLLIEGDNLSQQGNTVYLDLRPVAAEVAQELGFSGERIASLPADKTQVALMSADKLETLQTAGNVLDALSWLPAVLALLLAAVAIEVARGARRSTLLAVGITLVGSAFFALVLQRLAGLAFVEAVTDGGPTKDAAEATWRIASDLLVALCVVVIVIGLVVVLGAWLVGPGRRATQVRAFLRPRVVRHPALIYGGVAVVYLAAVAWGPLTAFARVWPVLLLAALLAVGLIVLHRRIVNGGVVVATDTGPGPSPTPSIAAEPAPSPPDAPAATPTDPQPTPPPAEQPPPDDSSV